MFQTRVVSRCNQSTYCT